MGCKPSTVEDFHVQHTARKDPNQNKNLLQIEQTPRTHPALCNDLEQIGSPIMESTNGDKSESEMKSQMNEELELERSQRIAKLKENLKCLENPNNFKDSGGEYTQTFVSAVSSIADVCTSVLMLESFSKKEKESLREELYQILSDARGIIIVCDVIVNILSEENRMFLRIRSTIKLVFQSTCLIHDFTDARPDLTHQIVNNERFMELLAVSLRDWVELNEEESKKRIEEYLRDSFLAIIHNMAMADLHTKVLRDMEFVDILVPYLDSNKLDERVSSFAALADIVNEEESEIVQRKPEILEFILSCLDEAINHKDRRSERASLMSTSELARIVRQVARNDTNKQVLSDLEALPLLVKLSTSDALPDQKEAVLALRTLTFDKNVQDKMVNGSDGVIERFITMRKSADADIRKTSNAALWTLREKMIESNKYKHLGQEFSRSDVAKKPNEEKKGHIMISYQWENQKRLLKIRDSIQKTGLKVWMDIDDMEGSTLQAMATAVENAEAILICYSQRYKDSPNCRAEAEYAFKLKKNIIPLKMERGYVPDGWLGMIEGSKLFYDFSGKYSFEHMEQRLLKALLNKKTDVFDQVDASPISRERPKSRTSRKPVVEESSLVNRSPSTINLIQVLRTWSSEQVVKWMNKNNLPKEKFGQLSGEEVAFLKVLSEKSPDFFFKTLESTLKIQDLKTLARVNFALEDLSA